MTVKGAQAQHCWFRPVMMIGTGKEVIIKTAREDKLVGILKWDPFDVQFVCGRQGINLVCFVERVKLLLPQQLLVSSSGTDSNKYSRFCNTCITYVEVLRHNLPFLL